MADVEMVETSKRAWRRPAVVSQYIGSDPVAAHSVLSAVIV